MLTSHAEPGSLGTTRVDSAAAIAEVLDRAAHRARTGRAAPARTARGSQAALWDTIARLRGHARREILSIDDTTFLVANGVPDVIRRRGPATLISALRRGVTVRQVTSRAGLLADRELGAIVHRAGGQARVVGQIPGKLSILDRKVALLPVDTTVLADGFQIVRDPDAVAELVALHRVLWRAGAPADGEVMDLPAHLAVILPALAEGEPDEVVSRRLGLSPRTYSRRVAELMTLLGARNRFQAGLEAGRRGWL